jgi:VanZ family protein
MIVMFLGYTAIWTALLLVPDVSSIPFIPTDLGEDLAYSEWPVDKIVHGGGYFVLTLLGAMSLIGQPMRAPLVSVFAGAALHGAVTEIAQFFIPQRSANLFDWFADLAGATVAVASVMLVRRVARGA